MFKKILSLILGLFGVYLKSKENTAEDLGKAEERSDALAKNIATMNKIAAASANAPTNMEQLMEEQRKGDV